MGEVHVGADARPALPCGRDGVQELAHRPTVSFFLSVCIHDSMLERGVVFFCRPLPTPNSIYRPLATLAARRRQNFVWKVWTGQRHSGGSSSWTSTPGSFDW